MDISADSPLLLILFFSVGMRLLLLSLMAFSVCATLFSQDAKNTLISEHIRARTDCVPPPATAMPTITWSTAAETKANNWANLCSYKHSSSGSGFGENLFAGSGFRGDDLVVLAGQAFTGWESEESGYHLTASGQSCTDRKSTRLNSSHRNTSRMPSSA